MSYGDFYFIRTEKLFIHPQKKEAELNVFRPLHLFRQIKILIPQSFLPVFQCPRW